MAILGMTIDQFINSIQFNSIVILMKIQAIFMYIHDFSVSLLKKSASLLHANVLARDYHYH